MQQDFNKGPNSRIIITDGTSINFTVRSIDKSIYIANSEAMEYISCILPRRTRSGTAVTVMVKNPVEMFHGFNPDETSVGSTPLAAGQCVTFRYPDASIGWVFEAPSASAGGSLPAQVDANGNLIIHTRNGVSGSAGAAIGIVGGNGDNNDGGQIIITGGDGTDGGTGGPVTIAGGESDGIGGSITIRSGPSGGSAAGNIRLVLGDGATSGNVLIENLPTTDPGVADALWCDVANGNALKKSLGNLN